MMRQFVSITMDEVKNKNRSRPPHTYTQREHATRSVDVPWGHSFAVIYDDCIGIIET